MTERDQSPAALTHDALTREQHESIVGELRAEIALFRAKHTERAREIEEHAQLRADLERAREERDRKVDAFTIVRNACKRLRRERDAARAELAEVTRERDVARKERAGYFTQYGEALSAAGSRLLELRAARAELAEARADAALIAGGLGRKNAECDEARAELTSLIEAFGGLCSLAEAAVNTADNSTFRDLELPALRAGCKMARRAIDRAWRRASSAAPPPAARREGEPCPVCDAAGGCPTCRPESEPACMDCSCTPCQCADPAPQAAPEHECGDDCMPARNLHFVTDPAPPAAPDYIGASDPSRTRHCVPAARPERDWDPMGPTAQVPAAVRADTEAERFLAPAPRPERGGECYERGCDGDCGYGAPEEPAPPAASAGDVVTHEDAMHSALQIADVREEKRLDGQRRLRAYIAQQRAAGEAAAAREAKVAALCAAIEDAASDAESELMVRRATLGKAKWWAILRESRSIAEHPVSAEGES